MATEGTFCIVVQQHLATLNCPLMKDTCMWKHRLHNQCTYDEKFASTQPSPNDYARHVGLPPISEQAVNIIRSQIVSKIREELST